MPSLATLQAFAATVESNDHVGAITKFYAPDAQTRENNNPPIAGRDVLAEKERRVLASVHGCDDHAARAVVPRRRPFGDLLAF